MNIYQDIRNATQQQQKLLAVLIDPEKVALKNLPSFFNKIHQSITTHIFVGGSTDKNNETELVVKNIKSLTNLPVILFPGSHEQITNYADGILFLSLISGRNPEFLIEQQIASVETLKKSDLEILPTGYMLIDGGNKTTVQKVSNTKPIAQNNINLIVNTALAGQFSGKKLIYLEAGSGATEAVSQSIISSVKTALTIPLIVGGGIRTKQQLENAYNAGADLVVIGTAFEHNEAFFDDLKKIPS